MILRPYQTDCIKAIYAYLREHDGNPCAVLPTAAGKTPVLATICREAVDCWNGRVIVLAHVKELLEQSADKLRAVAPHLPVGVYSAGLGRRDLGYAVTVAGIQSIYQKASELGRVDLVIVDEAHLIPEEGDGMYRTFLEGVKAATPHARIIGLTATPYRMKSGSICGPEKILNEICFEVGVRELITQGYLCPLRSKAGEVRVDLTDVRVRAGEFIANEVEDRMNTDSVVEAAVEEIVDITRGRQSVLIFCSGVEHGQHVASVFREKHGIECGFVEGNTPPLEREALLRRFRCMQLKYLANVNVLTTGFDAPNIDAVAMLRPTMSPGLYYQMVGRGFRLHPGKSDCIVLDFGGNVLRHGPVDAIAVREPGERGSGAAPAKECPACMALIAAGYQVCPECGYQFPAPEKKPHESEATNAGVLTGQVERETLRVIETAWKMHFKRDDPDGTAPPTMRVEYMCGFNRFQSEWVCFEHRGYAREKAEAWWRRRSRDPVPTSVEEAIGLAVDGSLAETKSITLERKAGEKYWKIASHELGELPPAVTGMESMDGLDELDGLEADAGVVAAERSKYTQADWDDIPF